MPRKIAIFGGLVAVTLALAIVFWIVNVIFAPHIFFSVARHFRPERGSPIALVALAATGPLIVAIPFGLGFGLLPWRRPMAIGFLVAAVAAGLNLAHSVWASVWAGYAFLDSRSWVTFLEAALLIALFGTAAALGARTASGWHERRRLVTGSLVLASLTAITFVSAYVWYESARAA